MNNPLDLIPKGYGTYVSVALIFGAELAKSLGWITPETYSAILVAAGGSTAMFLRRAIGNPETPPKP